MEREESPFERYDLDPRDGIAAITQRLKELAEDAKTDAERERIRADWEELTLHPARRLRAALFTHPETRLPLGMPPSLARRRSEVAPSIGLQDLVLRPSVVEALGLAREEDDVVPSLDDDPLLDL